MLKFKSGDIVRCTYEGDTCTILERKLQIVGKYYDSGWRVKSLISGKDIVEQDGIRYTEGACKEEYLELVSREIKKYKVALFLESLK